MYLFIVLCAVDLIWLFSIFSAWTTYLNANPVWNELGFLHHLAIWVSIINLLIKLGLCGALF